MMQRHVTCNRAGEGRQGTPRMWVAATLLAIAATSQSHGGAQQAAAPTQSLSFGATETQGRGTEGTLNVVGEAAATGLSTTTTTTSPTNMACPGIKQCQADPFCSVCLAAVNQSGGLHSSSAVKAHVSGITHSTNGNTYSWVGAYETAVFDSLLATPACFNASIDLMAAALEEVGSRSVCVEMSRMAMFSSCPFDEYFCFVNPVCRECWTAVTEVKGLESRTKTATEVVRTPACRKTFLATVNTTLRLSDCEIFPACSHAKLLCGENAGCTRCLETLEAGDVAAAVRQCPQPGWSASLLDNVVRRCELRVASGCEYTQLRCRNNASCAQCSATLDASGRRSATEIASALNTAACLGSVPVMEAVAAECWSVGSCQSHVGSLYVGFGTRGLACLDTVVRNPAEAAFCKTQLSYMGVDEACRPCPTSLGTINSIVLATSVVGGISATVCLWAVLTIVAHGRARVSMRDRVVVGLLLANMVYSSANVIPMNAVHTDMGRCGQLVLSFRAMRWGRASWFGGKYGLVAFELLIVGASLSALRWQSAIRPRTEAALHATCAAVGIVGFAVFYGLCDRINAAGYNADTETESFTNAFDHLSDDATDDQHPASAATQRFDSGRSAYDNLVRHWLLAWDVLAGLTVVLWVLVRVLYRRVLNELRSEGDTIEAARARDEWADTRQSEWRARYSVLEARKAAFAHVAIPLEPYLAVFLLFLIPAGVMSTDYCREQSSAQDTTVDAGTEGLSFGLCDVGCELALAFRSLFTVAVYLQDRRRRSEFAAIGTTCRKLGRRVFGLCKRTAVAGSDNGPGVEMGALSQAYELPLANARQIPEADVELQQLIGKGSYGEVWDGRWASQGVRVAIKRLYSPMVSEDGEVVDTAVDEDFWQEVSALRRLNHPHALKFFGYGITAHGAGFIVNELMPEGSLEAALHDDELVFPWRDRVSVGLQVALGMRYLHDASMVHRDLKSPNILLSHTAGNVLAKICDFGLARIMRRPQYRASFSPFTGVTQILPVVGDLSGQMGSQGCKARLGGQDQEDLTAALAGSMTTMAGTLPWMAPEVFRGDRTYGKPADVYSYGVVLYELATRRSPWTELGFQTERAFAALLSRALQTGQRPHLPTSVTAVHPQFIEIMQRCWAGDPADRPLFSDVTADMAHCLSTEC